MNAGAHPARWRLALEWLAIFAGAVAVLVWSAGHGTTRGLDLALMDRIAARTSPASDQILIVGIDERSLAELGHWPWDRRHLAQLVDRLHAGGARGIALDVLLTEPTDPGADGALGQALRRAGAVVLPWDYAPAEGRVDGFAALPPTPAIARGAAALGEVVLRPDPDGLVRRIPLRVSEGPTSYPHLAVALLRAAGLPLRAQASDEPVLPLRRAGSYRMVPAAAVIRGEVPDAFVRGRLVLVGASAAGLGDTYAVSPSAGGQMAGIELQANLVQALQAGGFIDPLGQGTALAVGLVALALLFAGFWRLSPAHCLWLAGGLALALVGLCLGLGLGAQLWFAPGPALLAMMLAYPLWGWRRLDAVSRYLGGKAASLAPAGGGTRRGGFDDVARQIDRLDGLIDEVATRRAFLRRVVESAPDPLCVLDADQHLLLDNAGARALFGADSAGRQWLDLLLDARAQMSADGVEMVLSDGRAFTVARADPPDGADWSAIQIVQLREVTALRRADGERRRLLEFLGHDMRSPQVAILGLAEGAGAEAAARLGRISNHARRTLDLADNFVALARLEATAPVREGTDLAALIDEAADRAWQAASVKAITVQAEHAGACYAETDAALLARVLDNLIGNAITYAPAKTIVSIRLHMNDAMTISVTDQGPGLPAARQADPFQRFGSSSGGAGLGLAFVAEAMARLGGTAQCATSPTGTTFTLSLPG